MDVVLFVHCVVVIVVCRRAWAQQRQIQVVGRRDGLHLRWAGRILTLSTPHPRHSLTHHHRIRSHIRPVGRHRLIISTHLLLSLQSYLQMKDFCFPRTDIACFRSIILYYIVWLSRLLIRRGFSLRLAVVNLVF